MNKFFSGKFPFFRPRRMRASESLRNLISETPVSIKKMIMPYFVREGENLREPIESMPGQFRFSVDRLLIEIKELKSLGVSSVLLFGIPEDKDDKAGSASRKNGIVQKAVRAIKQEFPEMLVMTDVCLCAYTSHGHCGLINARGKIDNDASLKVLADVALSHAEAGADMVAPSDMMDGRIKAIRERLDEKGLERIPILSYAAKYASAFYGPFRDAAHSAPQVSGRIPTDRKSYQMDSRNRKEALREIAMDIEEGADMVMVKPALAYLDVIREAWDRFCFPLVAYSVSGEYAMIKAASEKGLIDEPKIVLETVTAFFRAGATAVISYHTKDFAHWQKDHNLL